MNIISLLNVHRPAFETYLRLLLKWNKAYNLTAITSPDEIWEKHFYDSLASLKLLPKAGTLLDIGCGAGFPGIPLKLARPTLSVTLLDAVDKKCLFCEAVIRELGLTRISHKVSTAAADKPIPTASRSKKVLNVATATPPRFFLRAPCIHGLLRRLATTPCEKCGLKDINVVHGRAEDKKIQERLGKFDVVISRATFSLKKYIATAGPYLKEGSVLIAMKGAGVQKELAEANVKVSALEEYSLPNSKAKRYVVKLDYHQPHKHKGILTAGILSQVSSVIG